MYRKIINCSLILLISLIVLILLTGSHFNSAIGQFSISPMPEVSIAGGRSVNSVITDIDGDGLNDILILNDNSNTIMIYLQNRLSGTNYSSSPDKEIQTKFSSDSLEVGDLNNDGKKDMVVTYAKRGENGILLYYQDKNRSLSFDVISLESGDNPCASAIGDLNNDGLNDLVYVNSHSNDAYIHYQTEGLIPVEKNVTLITGQTPFCVKIGDFNGDRLNDIVISNEFTNKTFIYYQREDNTFNPNPDLRLNIGRTWYFLLALGDLNNDGLDDLVIANNIFYQREGQGLNEEPDIIVSEYGKPFIGDLNNDSLNDLIISSRDNGVFVYLQTNNENSISLEANYKIFIKEPKYSSIGDINNDSLADIVTSTWGSGEVYLNLQGLDTDLDFYPDYIDKFPYDPKEWEDSDNDGVGDNTDDYPDDPSKWKKKTEAKYSYNVILIIILILIFILLIFYSLYNKRKKKHFQIEKNDVRIEYTEKPRDLK